MRVVRWGVQMSAGWKSNWHSSTLKTTVREGQLQKTLTQRLLLDWTKWTDRMCDDSCVVHWQYTYFIFIYFNPRCILNDIKDLCQSLTDCIILSNLVWMYLLLIKTTFHSWHWPFWICFFFSFWWRQLISFFKKRKGYHNHRRLSQPTLSWVSLSQTWSHVQPTCDQSVLLRLNCRSATSLSYTTSVPLWYPAELLQRNTESRTWHKCWLAPHEKVKRRTFFFSMCLHVCVCVRRNVYIVILETPRWVDGASVQQLINWFFNLIFLSLSYEGQSTNFCLSKQQLENLWKTWQKWKGIIWFLSLIFNTNLSHLMHFFPSLNKCIHIQNFHLYLW